MLWLYRYLRGYLKIIIKGKFNENILNICAVNGIIIWKSRLVKKNIETHILIKDFKKLRKLMRGSNIRIHIIKKVGLPFKLKRNKERSGLLLGALLLFIGLYIMSGYIWVIDIVGNTYVKDAEILNSLRKIGVTEGIKASVIDPKVDREKFLLTCENLAWASLNVEGSRLTVNVTEIDKTKPTNTPTNLKAKADGIIKKIDVTSGNCVVKVGDTVKKGDLLVSGINENIHNTAFVKSLGSIYAETTREYKITEKFNQKITSPTGYTKTKKVLEVFNIKIPLYLGKETESYTSSTKIKNIKLFGKTLPIRFYSRKFEFEKTEKFTFKKQEILKKLDNELIEKAKKDKVENFTVTSKEYIENRDGITLKAIIKSEENIAVSEQILF